MRKILREPIEAHMPLDPDHEVDLKGGNFEGTTSSQLTQAFAKFSASGSHHVCLFFHGGLVSRSDGLNTASQLITPYTQSGAYPFFFIWNSDLLTVIGELLHPHQNDPAFVAAANRCVKQAAARIAAILNLNRGLKEAAKAQLRATPMDLESLARFAEPYDRAWAQSRGEQLPVSTDELTDFGGWLLKLKPEARRRVLFTRTKIRGPKNPFGRVIERLNSGHGHGLYTTVIEELLIAIGVADHLAAPVWGQMKADIDAAFAKNASAGGTAFLRNLEAAWKRDPDLKVTLIGHSAGAIYLQRFVEAFDDFFISQPTYTVEILTLAAAVSFERMSHGLAVLKKRTRALRMFGLSDRREGGYWEVPGIYNKSLLYIVSSLCEEDPQADKALVGMQRYWSGKRPYDQPYINAVTDFVEVAAPPRTVWSPSSKSAAPGYQSDADRHGGFPLDPKTNESVCYALKRGF